MTQLGWFHTVLGILALVSGVYALIKYKEISFENRSGQLYLLATLVTAGIDNHSHRGHCTRGARSVIGGG